MRKTLFAVNSTVEPSVFFIEKISFSLKLFSGHFYGQSFIKTVRGPLIGFSQMGKSEMRQFFEFLLVLYIFFYFLVCVHHNNYNIGFNFQYKIYCP